MRGSRKGRLANALLVLVALPFAVVLGLALGGLSAHVTTDQLVFFYAVPALWIAATGLAFRLPASVRGGLVLGLMGVGLALVAMEVVMDRRFAESEAGPPHPPLLGEVLRVRAGGVDAFPKISGNSMVALSPGFPTDSGVVHPVTPAPGRTTVLLCNENGPLVSYDGDRLGFDNPESAWSVRRPDLVLIGDSHIEGCVADPHHRLGALLRNHWTVLSFGVSGAGPLQELAMLREFATRLSPPVVVWVYSENNDLTDLSREQERHWLRSYLTPGYSQALYSNRETITSRYRAWVDSLVAAGSVAAGAAEPPTPAPSLGDVLRLRAVRHAARFEVPFPARRSPLGLLPQILERARDDVAEWGGQLVLVYVPGYLRYDARLGAGFEGHAELMAFAERAGIPVVDLVETFDEVEDPLTLWGPAHTHLDPDGYRLAAEATAKKISSLLPSRPPDA